MRNEDSYAEVPLHLIREPSHQLRERINPERLGELADSIAAEGLHQAIGLRGPLDDGTYEVIWGHRRFLATSMLKRDTIAAKIHSADYDPLLAAVSENIQREDLSPVEEAIALNKFIDRGEPIAALARLFRRSLPWVYGRLALLDLPEDLKEAVHTRIITLGVAEALADIDHEEYRKSLIAEAQRTGATATTVNIWRAHYLSDRARIQENFSTVENIIANREKFIFYCPCEGCNKPTPYGDTRSLRLCLPCMEDLTQAFQEQLAELTTQGAA